VEGLFLLAEDFTFVCPTEIAAFGKMNKDFSDRTRRYWRQHGLRIRAPGLAQSHPDLKELPFPMLADIKRELCAALEFWTRRREWRSGRPSWWIRIT